MFQGSEIFVILLVALVVLGPERMPALARKMGQWTSELRKAASELRAGLESEIGDVSGLVSEIKAPIEEIKKVARDTSKEARGVADDVNSATKWIGPKPLSGPTPEEAMRDLEAIEAAGAASDTGGSGGSNTPPQAADIPTPEIAEAVETSDVDEISKASEPPEATWIRPKVVPDPSEDDDQADEATA